MDANATGRFIARCRKQKGYTQKELAEKLMVTDKAISRWETGKGLPDTSLLKPLGDALGVSVGELLSGEMIEETEMKDRTDEIILESLNYAKRTASDLVRAILFIVGFALAISPLFLASQSYIWIAGIAVIATAILCTSIERKGASMKTKNKQYYGTAIVLQCAALILEILPVGAVMVFATGPEERIIETYSYFSLLPMGYANAAPMLTGILTIATLSLGGIAALRFDKSAGLRKTVLVCSGIALLLSVVPLFLFGTVGMTAASYAVSGMIFLSFCLQAMACRNG